MNGPEAIAKIDVCPVAIAAIPLATHISESTAARGTTSLDSGEPCSGPRSSTARERLDVTAMPPLEEPGHEPGEASDDEQEAESDRHRGRLTTGGLSVWLTSTSPRTPARRPFDVN